ncbi:divalent-cation tolerance protein CutA [Streptomyces sp. NPDC005548]|uniref:divalent-cation tolerance protein CutA n=1 Tax=Streptomyces sp. NPDC005548 TaxID=3364724 RepID=UPI0036A3A7DB
MADFLNVSTATATREQAVILAESAVRAKLAAGAQIVGPLTSVFWHAGVFGTGEEYQLLLKTTDAKYSELEAHLVAHHPWDNPEVIGTVIEAGAIPYLAWIERTLAD